MNSKWPKFLTLKRIVLVTIVLVLGIVLGTYFLGGYKGITISYDTREFTLEGFTSYTEYEQAAREEAVKIPYDEGDSLQEKVEKCNYISQLQTVISEINKTIKELESSGGNAQEIADLKALQTEANRRISYRELPNEADYIKSYIAEALGFGDEPLMSNGSYEFYFNKKWTTFKIVEKKTGNVWYSNPIEDETFTTSASTKRQQQSLLNIYYAGSLGGTTMWDSYTLAISDTDSTGEDALTPNFQIKEIKDEKGNVTSLQVYYYFKQRGIDYSFFPAKFSYKMIENIANVDLDDDENLPELIRRNKESTTDGAWEVIASLASASMDDSVQAEDHSIWHAGSGAPNDDEGDVNSYYIDLETNDIYVKTTKTARNGDITEYWEVINTKSLTWKKYFESNVTYNNLADGLPVYEYAYSGEGAPVAEDGLNDFYYYDSASKQLYKKTNGTLPYTHSLAGKEVTVWTTSYYAVENKELDTNTYGYDYYKYNSVYESMKSQVRKRLYSYFYVKCLYDENDLIADNNEFGATTVSNKGEFGIAIEYTLNEQGLSATILDQSIYELEEFPITSIEILPYFTSAHYNKEGYVVIPDGSGTVMNYNNGKTSYVQYVKSVYTTDLTRMQEIKQTDTEDLMLAMYAMVNTNIPGNDGVQSGVLVDGVIGRSQLSINANVSKISDSYNKIFFSASYRESQKTTIGVGYYAKQYTKWTEERNHNDITINYHFLESDELNYSAIAKKYRDILIERYDIEAKDTTDQTVLNVSLIGAYDYRNNFLGIGYRDYGTMTTFEQAEEILSDLRSHGSNHINAYYIGWRKKGLINESYKNMNYNSNLGSKKDLESLVNYSSSNGIDLYMDVTFGEVNKFQESYGRSKYGARDVAGEYVEKYPYSLAQEVYDKKQNASYVISPRYYGVFMESLVDNYLADIGLTNISIKNLGSTLSSDFKRHQELFKETGLNETISALEYAVANGIENITLYNPYDFAFEYTTNALEVPYTATQYEVFDYSIPLYQLIVSGLFDYSGQVINANDEKGSQWHIMHILETGSNVAFTFSYEDSSKLIQTDYKNYYYTQYSKWVEDVNYVINTIDEIGIHSCELVSHELLANSVYKVTYAGNDNIEIILNYSDAAVEIDGNIIPAKDYIYSKNNSGWRG